MRIQLKGLNSVAKTLADGSIVTYYYAWKGGPRLKGKPGTPEFIASYHEAVSTKSLPPSGILLALLHTYQTSSEFSGLRERTRADYIKQIKQIEVAFGDMPLNALNARQARSEFMAWRDQLATRSRRQADYAWTVLARILSWSKDRGLVLENPCERGGRLYRGSRADKVWTADDEATFYRSAPAHLHLPVILALWTGQREGDLLRLTWSAYDGETIRLKQSKTGARVIIPVGAPLKAALDAEPRLSPVILLTSEGKPWTPDGFRASFAKAKAKAGVVGVTFNDLRGTAVTRLALAAATEAEIATITGHSLRDVRSILDSNYLHRDPALGRSAILKLERGTKIPN
jgi:integrase